MSVGEKLMFVGFFILLAYIVDKCKQICYIVFTRVNNIEGDGVMKQNFINLTTAEWNVMECLWEQSPLTGRQMTDLMENRMGWNRSTTLTLLRRLEEKGAVRSDSKGAKKIFCPGIAREDAAHQETESFLERVYGGSVSMMVSAMTKKQALSKKEIDELYAMLKELEGGH